VKCRLHLTHLEVHGHALKPEAVAFALLEARRLIVSWGDCKESRRRCIQGATREITIDY